MLFKEIIFIMEYGITSYAWGLWVGNENVNYDDIKDVRLDKKKNQGPLI